MDTDRIKGAAKDVGGKIEETIGRAIGDQGMQASGIGRQVEGVGQNLYGQAKDGLHHLGSRAEHALRETSDLADQAYDESRRYVKSAANDLAREVYDQPLLSLIGAVAIGFVAGVLFSRA